MSIIADRDRDRNFRYAGKKGLSREIVRPFPIERTYSKEQFLQAIESGVGPWFPLSPYQGVLWGKRPKEHRPRGVLQTMFGGLS